MTTSKNTPKMFKIDMKNTAKTHIGSDYISHIDPQEYTITVEPLEHHINCEIIGKILGYRDLVKMDAPLWTNSMCNELGRLYQVWKHIWGLIKSNLYSI